MLDEHTVCGHGMRDYTLDATVYYNAYIQNADDAKASAVKFIHLVDVERWSSSSCQDLVDDGEQQAKLMDALETTARGSAMCLHLAFPDSRTLKPKPNDAMG